MSEEKSSCTTLIEVLPDEIIYNVVSYLNENDIDSCFNVCKRWRYILNSNQIWKMCCVYPEKYLKTYNQLLKTSRSQADGTCLWRQYYECQTRLWKNWNVGKFKKVNTGIALTDIQNLYMYVDDRGNHWLFGSGSNGVTVWNISSQFYIQSCLHETDHSVILPLKDKLITSRSDYIKVFQFSHPNYTIELKYRFIFSMDDVLPKNEIVPVEYSVYDAQYIVVDNMFVGYYKNIKDLYLPALHIWDLDREKKIATKDVFQQSFVNFVSSTTGFNALDDFEGRLTLFEGDSGHFLVTLYDCRSYLCQISLYSLAEMRFVQVIARIKSLSSWCSMKKHIIAIYHVNTIDLSCPIMSSQISVYDDSGQFLAKLDHPHAMNPYISGQFWFTGSRVFLKLDADIQVLSINNSRDVTKHSLHTKLNNSIILAFFEPKYLMLLYYKECRITVWDIDSGTILWNLELSVLMSWRLHCQLLQTTKYPGTLVLQLKDDLELSILNFQI